MSITVVRPGFLTTVQDLGRIGFRRYGVVLAGAMDRDAARRANRLVGNRDDDALLETTLIGPTLRFDRDAVVAYCGANFAARVDQTPLRMERPILIPSGAMLHCGNAETGCRGYLAIRGGIDLPLLLGSRATDLRSGFGGLAGRALLAEDRINILSALHFPAAIPRIALPQSRGHSSEISIRTTRGLQQDWFTVESIERFYSQEFRIASESDRMGYRLDGPSLGLKHARELASAAVCFGTIQVPHDGRPILLGADHPTTGGYPKIAQAIGADRSLIAQAKPGDQLRFVEVSIADARRALLDHETIFREQCHALELAWKECR